MFVTHSIPERFVMTLSPGESSAASQCTFDIPAGSWSAGRWEVVGNIPSGAASARKTAGSDTLTDGDAGAERYALSGEAGPDTLKAINLAAGGPFVVNMTDVFAKTQPDGVVDAVISFTLTLEGIERRGAVDGVSGVTTLIYHLPGMERRARTGVSETDPHGPDASVGRIVTYTYAFDGRLRR